MRITQVARHTGATPDQIRYLERANYVRPQWKRLKQRQVRDYPETEVRKVGLMVKNLARGFKYDAAYEKAMEEIERGPNGTPAEERVPVALAVDDDEVIRDYFTTALHYSGWQCVSVPSGQAALKKLKERQFDVIFLDLLLPGLTGAETFREIRLLRPEAKVVIVTGHGDSDLMAQALSVGPFAVMLKPFSLDKLRMTLAHVSNGAIARGK